MMAPVMTVDGETRRRLASIMSRFDRVGVLVVGDLILDKYTIGRPTRISREAPIAVLEFVREYALPGGGTSPACTVASLGGRAYVVGVVGDDSEGRELKEVLQSQGVDIAGVVTDRSRPTIAKKRVVAQVTPSMLQQVARIDYIDRRSVDGDVESALFDALDEHVAGCDAVLLSNYKSGTLTPAVVEHAREQATRLGKILAVDSQGDLDLFHGFGIIKCNQPEAEASLGTPLESEEEFEAGMRSLIDSLEAETVIVTRSAEGMSVMTRDGEYCHIPVTNTSEVFDVTGAGDTVIALVTLGMAAGAGVFDAARLANVGAGIVVRHWGNAVLRPAELRDALS